MKKKKIITVILLLSLIVSTQNVKQNIDAKMKQSKVVEKREETILLNLTDVSENARYSKAVTEKKQWKKDADNKFLYPNNGDKEEWKDYKTHMEMIEACTVPDEVLNNATTEQLLDLVFDYPLLCDIYAYNSNEEGLSVLASQFNVFGELMERENLSDIALERYLDTEILDVSEDSEQNFDVVSEVVVLEGILAQEDIVEDLTNKEQKKLVRAVKEKIEEKQKTELFQENLSSFYDIAENNGVVETLGMEGYEKVASETVQASSSTTYVKTPNGTKVTVEKNDYKGNSWAKSLTEKYEEMYPLATRLGLADNRYNCHSYAWYSASTSNRYWMNNPKAYVNDGSYKYVGTSPTASNQIIEYKNQYGIVDSWIHSGITVNTTGLIKSKWGQAPLMKHGVHYCPYAFNFQFNVIHYYKKA